MILSEKQIAGSLELARIVLASLAIWLAVTSVVTCDATAVSPTTSAAVAVSSQDPVEAANSDIPLVLDTPILAVPESDMGSAQLLAAVDEQDLHSSPVAGGAAISVLSAAPADFAFPADLGGEILSERLIPPAHFDVPPVPFVSQPKPWHGLRFDPLPRDVPPLTATVIPREPGPASRADLAGLSGGTIDFPSLPRDSTPVSVTPLPFHPQPRSFVPSVDPNQVPALPISSAPPKEKIGRSFDPARGPADTWLFSSRAPAAASPTPFIKLSIPDPFEQVRAIRLTHPIAELDAPLFPTGRPLRLTLRGGDK